jgi:hypothetical protein
MPPQADASDGLPAESTQSSRPAAGRKSKTPLRWDSDKYPA